MHRDDLLSHELLLAAFSVSQDQGDHLKMHVVENIGTEEAFRRRRENIIFRGQYGKEDKRCRVSSGENI